MLVNILANRLSYTRKKMLSYCLVLIRLENDFKVKCKVILYDNNS